MRSFLTAALALAWTNLAFAIYPDDHWNYSTKLTEENFDSFVQAGIDAGKTVQAPAWNSVTRAFAGNNDVLFGDVNLGEDGIRRNYNPGAGGWPTIRYFTKETGMDGSAYSKKTSMSMCDELGPDHDYMQEYVEEAGNTSLCQTDGTNCDERSLVFLNKKKEEDPSSYQSQIDRLTTLLEGDMKEDLKAWVKARRKILMSLSSEASIKEEL